MPGLDDAVAVVTGGAGGIGHATANLLADADATVVTADVRDPPKELRDRVHHVPTDLTDGESVDRLYTEVLDRHGAPTVLVLAHGAGVHERLTEGDPATWERVLQVNVLGVLRPLRSLVPAMLDAGGGDVVVVGSVAAERAYERGGVYGASKAAVHRVADTLRLETPATLRVTTVAPGTVDTAFFQRSPGHVERASDVGTGALDPGDVAREVVHALERPRDVAVNHVTVRPSTQSF